MTDAAPLHWPLILADDDLPRALIGETVEGEVALTGYANLFPLAYFRAYAPHVVLAPTATGAGRVRIDVQLAAIDGATRTIRSETADLIAGETWRGEGLTLSDLPETGALFLVLAPETDARIIGAAWTAESAPRRDVRLSVGIATFNRPDDVARTVDLLAARRGDGVAEVHVVDQGQERADFPDLPGFLHTYVQRNLGGAGGFARALAEALAAERATHHVFMDDDAFPQAEIFARLRFFLAHAAADHAVGGQMLALEDPLQMTEFGVRLSRDGERENLGRGLRVDRPEVAALSHRVETIDAHAWWFWAVPLAAAKAAGPPLPVFIKFDDIEYTDRLSRAGVASAPLPGLFIRHPAIHMKAADWRYYYFARNAAIAASSFGRDGVGRIYGLKTLLGSLLRHEYRRLELEIMALDDYLAGTQFLAEGDEEAIHDRVRALSNRLRGPDAVELKPGAYAEAPALSGEPASETARYLAAFLRSWLPTRAERPFVWSNASQVDPIAASRRSYLRPMAKEGTFELYAFDRRRYLSLLPRALWAAVRFAAGARRASREWSENAARLIAAEAWAKRLEARSSEETR
ncbi:MAG: glycosyltransferase [Pseudomonadota bacterium]